MSLQHKIQFAQELWKSAVIDAKRSDRNRWGIMRDTVRCRLQLGLSVNDYTTFGFAILPEELRLHYLSVRENFFFTEKMNNKGYYDKWYTYKRLAPFYQRAMVNLKESPKEEIDDFLGQYHNFFAKKPKSTGGEGVLHIKWDTVDDSRLSKLREEGFVLLEECINQHPTMDKLNPHCINTIRIVTCVNKEGEVLVLPVIVRVGAGEKEVDNISSGGFYTLVTPDGKIGLDGFYQENLAFVKNNQLIEKTHPLTGMNPLGFEIPYFSETIERVKEMARSCPDFALAGWDIAITPNGPDIVEVNNFAGVGINENYYFTQILGLPHVGAKTAILNHVGGHFAADGSFEYFPE